jgi:hypothetical protein
MKTSGAPEETVCFRRKGATLTECGKQNDPNRGGTTWKAVRITCPLCYDLIFGEGIDETRRKNKRRIRARKKHVGGSWGGL